MLNPGQGWPFLLLLLLSPFESSPLCGGAGAEEATTHSHRVRLYPHSEKVSSIVSRKYRTGYHFQPRKNWINDPNGPMYYNGVYHLFYQYNPGSVIPGNKTWGHSVSTDLVNWLRLEPALDRTEPYDAKGCWSGSVTILANGRPAILYTGADGVKNQAQCIAFPSNNSDPYLREWTKPDSNPVLAKDTVVDDRRLWPRIDYGNYYASKSFFDSNKGRRIIWGWANESVSAVLTIN